jgi:hypothetical protein
MATEPPRRKIALRGFSPSGFEMSALNLRKPMRGPKKSTDWIVRERRE